MSKDDPINTFHNGSGEWSSAVRSNGGGVLHIQWSFAQDILPWACVYSVSYKHAQMYFCWMHCWMQYCIMGHAHKSQYVLSKHHHPMWKVWSFHCKSSNIFKSFYSIDIVSNHCMSIHKLIYWSQGRFFTSAKELTQKLLNSFLWTWMEDGSQTPLTFGVDTDKGTDQGTKDACKKHAVCEMSLNSRQQTWYWKEVEYSLLG